MTAEPAVEEAGPAEPLDLAAIAAAHPARHVVLDLAALDVRALLSVGDVEDMAAALDTDPGGLVAVLKRGGDIAYQTVQVLAWVIGRKADPGLGLETVRRSWQIEVRGDPPTARRVTAATRRAAKPARPTSLVSGGSPDYHPRR